MRKYSADNRNTSESVGARQYKGPIPGDVRNKFDILTYPMALTDLLMEG